MRNSNKTKAKGEFDNDQHKIKQELVTVMETLSTFQEFCRPLENTIGSFQ